MARRGRRTRAPPPPPRAPAGRRCAGARPACAGRGRRPGPGRSGPARAAPRHSTVHEPMPGIARSAPPAPLVVGVAQVDAPLATSRAARRSASARPAERSKDSSSAGAVPASAAALGRSRSVVAGAPRPSAAHDPPLDPGGARVLDQLLADRPGQRLERLRPARRAQPGRAAHERADQRVGAEAAVERREVVVDAEREAHPRERDLAGAARARPRRRSARCARRPARRARAPAAPRRAAAARARRRARRITPSAPPPGSRSGQRGSSSTRRSQMPGRSCTARH